MSSESLLLKTTPVIVDNSISETDKDKEEVQEIDTSILFNTENTEIIEPIKDKSTVQEVDTPFLDKQKENEARIVEDTSSAIFGDGEQAEGYEVSSLEKLEYGWDKNQMVAGNILRTGRNLVEALFDSDKNFVEVTEENETERVKEFEKEHWKMLDGENDGAYTMIGEGASFIVDPYYLLGYFYGAGMMRSPLTSAVLNGALLGGDNLFEQLAKTGKVNTMQVGQSAVIGATIGAVLPYGAKLISKLAPNLMKSKVQEVTKFMDDKIAKVNGVTPEELILIRTAAKTDKVQKITNQIDDLVVKDGWQTTSSNFAAKLNQAENNFLKLKNGLVQEAWAIKESKTAARKLISNLTPERKVTFGIGKTESVIKLTQAKIKADAKKILDIKVKLKTAKDAWLKQNKELTIRASARVDKFYRLEGERVAAILAELDATAGIGSKVLKALLTNVTRPLVGAATGGAANIGAGVMGLDVEDNIKTWMITGAFLGLAQKQIQKSIKIPLGQKDALNKVVGNHAYRYALQRMRELTAGSVATKLNSFGGASQKISRLLFRQVDDSMASKSVIAQADSMDRYFLERASNIIKNSTPRMQVEANSILRGNTELAKTASKETLDLAKNLKGFLDEINLQASKAGFFNPKKLENYFPRVLNWDVINSNRPKAVKIFTEIFRKNYNYSPEKARKTAEAYLARNEGPGVSSVINTNAWNKILEGSERGVSRKVNKLTGENDLIITPMSDHIIKQRALQGEFNIVESVLEREGFLINDLSLILPKIVQDSTKSIAFSRTFGKGGSLLRPILEQIKTKYDDLAVNNNKILGNTTKQDAAKHETDLVLDSIDAYFDRYQYGKGKSWSSGIGIITMMSNLNMLGRVTISSLGDIVQPFTHSKTFSAAFKGMARTNLFKASWEKGLAQELGYAYTNEMSRSIARTAATEGQALALSGAWMGKWGVKEQAKNLGSVAFYNNIAFKGLGLEWLTGYARRFAYNAGSSDAYNLSRQYFKIVNGAKGVNSRGALQIKKDLYEAYGITANQALTIGQGKSFNISIKNKTAKRFLQDAGLKGANRDALIPQVDNRLLFTQSKDPRIRMLGQFLSWSQAKSAQTNKILMRIEDGSAKQLIKLVAAIPVYAGIQQFRELAKHGTVVTDYKYNKKELLAKSWQLSGQPGWLSDLFYNRAVGPGSKSGPFFVFAPSLNLLSEAFLTAVDLGLGKIDSAWERADKKLLPTPEWREWIRKFWFPKSGSVGSSSGITKTTFAYGGVVRKKFNKGDYATSDMGYVSAINEIEKDLKEPSVVLDTSVQPDEVPNQEIIPKEKPMNKKDLATIASAAVIATGVATQMDKVMPKKKPIIKSNLVIEKNYDNVSDLEPIKKKWLTETATKVYTVNKNNIIPSDILLSIASGETGWGSSGFLKRDSKNLFNFQSFDDKEESIAASQSKAKIKKFKTEEASIEQFLNWIETKESYAGVREEIKLFNEGSGSKANIIDAIAKTGFAEDKKWGVKIKYILNNRIDGKHKKELKDLANNLFKDTNDTKN